ncbi:DUF3987 domain-containing protein [Planctomicrobium sp. SH661]|uniref:YfjI family protein n=1 Tax=Planctomicrobium sp. SH661 TaxID=3448124 RepID=UPI003F5BF7C2
MSGLFPDCDGRGGVRPTGPKTKKPSKTFKTGMAAIAELERRNGKPSKVWRYYNTFGDVVGAVVRWNQPDGTKEIRPIAKRPDGEWVIGAMESPRPLYELPTLFDANQVFLCEGEKAADAARSLGLIATCSAGGCGAAIKTDWCPLAGKDVVILPDNDEAGEQYAADVVRLLSSLTPAPTVKVVRLPNLPRKGDMYDWVAARGTREELVRLVNAAEPIKREPAEKEGPDPWPLWEPFPTDCLPEPVCSLVVAGANAIGCDETYIALPALAVCAAAIGSTRRLKLRKSWRAPSTLWMAVVADSGSGKSPAFKLATSPVRERQQRLIDDSAGNKPERIMTSNVTVEALSVLLRDNPRGLLMAVDELAGWFSSFGQYNGRSIGDVAAWLSLFDGDPFLVDRKTGDDKTIAVPRSAVSVCGTIQPATLRKALSADHRESGLAARLLMACPPKKQKRWREADIDEDLEDRYANIIERLYDLQPFIHPETSRLLPVDIELSQDAKARFVEFYNSHNLEQLELSGDLAASWSKLEQIPLRLALALHCIRQASGESVNTHLVDAETMQNAIRLTSWFKSEAKRVYAMLSETDAERDERKLLEWIERKGGRVTAREVQQGCRWLREKGVAESALEKLVKSGRGRWKDSPMDQRGKPTRYFILSTCLLSTIIDKSNVSANIVDVDNVDAVDDPAFEEFAL